MLRYTPLLALVLFACASKPKRYFVRVVQPDGRAYYTHTDKALYTESGGFVTFRDLVTKEDVRLVNGFRLEDAFSEYKTSPSAFRGESCQDCAQRAPSSRSSAASVYGL